MKRFSTLLLLMIITVATMQAQNSFNSKPDAIVGTYRVVHDGEVSKVRVYRCGDGSYAAQCIYLQDSIDKKTGKLRLDSKNPDKNLRTVPCNKVVILRALRYNAKKQRWDGGRIYDPTRGIKAHCTCEFEPDGRLKLRGSVMGIGETIYWIKL